MPALLQGDASPHEVLFSTSIDSGSWYNMTEEEKEFMNRYGITVEQKSVYY